MDNYTAVPDEEYDVLIDGDLSPEPELCPKDSAEVLSGLRVLQLCSVVFMLGLLDNAGAVFILVRHKGLRQAENVYLLNLAVSNLCFLLALPFWAHSASRGGSLGDPACRVLLGLGFLGVYSEALLNALLTVQSHVALFHVRCLSTTLRTVPGSITSSILAWVVAVLVALPELLFYEPPPGGLKDKCSFSGPHLLSADETFWKYALTVKMNILVLVIPLSVFLFCYVRMRVRRRSWERQHQLPKLPFAMTAIFLLMWAPYNIALVLSAFKEFWSLPGCEASYHLGRSVQVTEIIATVHCCVNPLLYVLLDGAFRKCLCGWCPGCKDTPPGPSQEPALDAPQEDQHHCTAL